MRRAHREKLAALKDRHVITTDLGLFPVVGREDDGVALVAKAGEIREQPIARRDIDGSSRLVE